MSLEVLAAREKEITEITSTLKAMLSAEESRLDPVASVVRVLLSDLCSKVRQHIDKEDSELYPNLLEQADVEIRNLVWGFQASDRPLCKEFEQYYRRWLQSPDLSLSDEFLVQTRALIEAVEERIERERAVMLPQLQESGLFRSSIAVR